MCVRACFVCVSTHVLAAYVHVCVRDSVCVCVCVCMWRPDWCQKSSCIALLITRWGRLSHSSPQLVCATGLPSKLALGIPSPPSKARITTGHGAILASVWVQGIQTPFLTLSWQMLYPLSCLSHSKESTLNICQLYKAIITQWLSLF